MRVEFRTNIDAYNEKRCFPEHFDAVPRKGDMVQVKTEFESYYRDKKLPISLEVVGVTWKEKFVGDGGGISFYETIASVELWYSEAGLKLARMLKADPL